VSGKPVTAWLVKFRGDIMQGIQDVEKYIMFATSKMRISQWLFLSVMAFITTGMLNLTACDTPKIVSPLRVRVMTFNICLAVTTHQQLVFLTICSVVLARMT